MHEGIGLCATTFPHGLHCEQASPLPFTPVHTHRRTCKVELPEGGGTQATPVRGILQHIVDDSANQHASAQLALEVLPRCTNVPCDHTCEERRGLWRCGCAQGGKGAASASVGARDGKGQGCGRASMSSVSVPNTHICRRERRAQAGQKQEVREATGLLGQLFVAMPTYPGKEGEHLSETAGPSRPGR